VELAELLSRIAPGKLASCFRATGGSEAVDIALQAAMVHTRRRGFLSLEDSYHGNSLAGLSVGASDNRETYPNLLQRCRKISPPLDANALDKVETQLKRRDIAAFIMEPISINLGVLIPDAAFMSGLERLCRRYGTLLIADEVATGFGRTGRLFATEHFDIEPDIMCLGKAITGGVAGLGAVITTREVARSMEKRGTFYSTYGWHPLSVEVALASIRDLLRRKARLLGHVGEMSEYFRERLMALEFREHPQLNIRGLAIGIDVQDEDYADRIQEQCRRRGLLVTTGGTVVTLLPPLTLDRKTAARGLDILEASV
jgi:adenosylmethionine-8-amino-7-oxononanoate aminotransferase